MKQNKKISYEEDLINQVKADFLSRQNERKPFEARWRLNSNFVMGNQYSTINKLNEVEEFDKQYFWQEREVFNHIAPIIESRLAKLSTVQPKMNVMPSSNEESDLKVARLCKDVLTSTYEKLNLKSTIALATQWSEITGTSFYKVVWNASSGKAVYLQNGKKVTEGEVEVVAVPPYEIYPESNSCSNLDECVSIIHAKAYNVKDIKNIWGVEVEGADVDTFSLSQTNNIGGLGYKGNTSKIVNNIKHNHAIVIEKYVSPSQEYPNGQLIVVCNNKLLFNGDLPYVNTSGNKRGFPFIRQISIENPGCFWGTSIVERIIPVQRAYNAVKNRKHEYLNRISMGVMTIEDGSVDTENLEEEGLSPGKVLVYRQGSTPPKMMQTQNFPNEFEREENSLLAEFSDVGGVSNIMTTTNWNNNLSGSAIELLVEQDSARLSSTIENIKTAVEQVAKQILKLYKQFAVTPRLIKISNTNGECDVAYFTNSNLSSEDVSFEDDSETSGSVSVKKEQILKLASLGILNNAEGKLDPSVRAKIFELFGLTEWQEGPNESVLQKNYADNENIKLTKNTPIKVLEIHNHNIHISSHIAFMLGKQFEFENNKNPQLEQQFLNHIAEHKKFLKELEPKNNINNIKNNIKEQTSESEF